MNLASQNSEADLSGHGLKPVDIIDFTLEAAGLNDPRVLIACRGGGIGRHAALRALWPNRLWEFESPPRHHLSAGS